MCHGIILCSMKHKIRAGTYDKNCINSLLLTSPSSLLQTEFAVRLSPVVFRAHPFMDCLADDCNNCCWSCSITLLWLLDCKWVGLDRFWLLLCCSAHVDCPCCCNWLMWAEWAASVAPGIKWLDCNMLPDVNLLTTASHFWQDSVGICWSDWDDCPLVLSCQLTEELKHWFPLAACCWTEAFSSLDGAACCCCDTTDMLTQGCTDCASPLLAITACWGNWDMCANEAVPPLAANRCSNCACKACTC